MFCQLPFLTIAFNLLLDQILIQTKPVFDINDHLFTDIFMSLLINKYGGNLLECTIIDV